jgi:hypothetical protein
MQIPTGQLATIQPLARGILEACRQAADDDAELPTLAQAFDQLMDVIKRIDADTRTPREASTADISEIGEYALRLHENLSAVTERLDLPDHREALASLAINIALWVAQQGGQIDTLEPVVDALAMLANTTADPQQLELLSDVFSQIIEAIPAVISQDIENTNPGRPWRILLLNHSIVATRSYNTGLMEAAFGLLTSRLPEDAANFFSEGMQQMEALDYPAHVREVMEKYHRQWTISRSLH